LLPPVWGDSDQIAQVVTNLIVNAQQVLTEWQGPRRVTVATEFDVSGSMVQISVIDSGPGVPLEIKLRIFEPFFTTKPVGEGTGIGLSVCHGIVTAHGGTISVEDAPGGGACFVVRLPVGQGAEASEAHAAVKPEPSPVNRRILIVDDEREVAEALSEILERSGYTIHIANSGEAALHRIGTYGYDVVLCDLRMPDMDGIELYRRLKTARPALAERFIVVTGDVLSATVQKFLDSTGVPCLEKPLTPVEVRRQVAAALDSSKLLRSG
jgi:CheY-like chemotaxis protein